MRRCPRGFTLIELTIAMLLSAMLGVVILKILITTSRFYAGDTAMRNARTVARSPLGLLRAELRGVESGGGLVAADSFSVTVRSPYAMGLLCAGGTGGISVSLLPADSLALASAQYSGFAVRDTYGAWTYVDGGTPAAGGASACSAAGMVTQAGGSTAQITASLPAMTLAAGSAVLLYQRVTYRFAPSAALPGRRALWREAGTLPAEELAAPFEASARFRFHTGASDSSRVLPATPLSATRGIELVLNGASEKPPFGHGVPVSTGFVTSVFFRNRGS